MKHLVTVAILGIATLTYATLAYGVGALGVFLLGVSDVVPRYLAFAALVHGLVVSLSVFMQYLSWSAREHR